MVAPAQRTVPWVGRKKPANIRSSVVFPHPTGPSSARNSPSFTARFSPSNARVGVVPG